MAAVHLLMIPQNLTPSRKRRRQKEADPPHLLPKEKEGEGVEKDHSLLSQMPALQAKILEAEALRGRRCQHVVMSGKPAAHASMETNANSRMPLLVDFRLKEVARREAPALIPTGQGEPILPKMTSLPLDLL